MKLRVFLFLMLFFNSFSVFASYQQLAASCSAWVAAKNAAPKPASDTSTYSCSGYQDPGQYGQQAFVDGSTYHLLVANFFAAGSPVCDPPTVWDSDLKECKKPPTCPSLPSKKKKGKSIAVETSNQYQEVDYVSGGSSALKLSRYYNSADTSVSNFGIGWRGAYSRSLNLSADVVEVIRDDGKSLTFNLVAGVWLPESDVNAQLSQTATGWTYIAGLDALETYNSNGQLTSITDHTGLATTLHYDAEGHLISVVNPLGRSLSFAYTASLVNFVTVADGSVYQYAYDANRLLKVTYPDQRFRRYLYENSQNPQVLTGIVDGKGKRFTIERKLKAGTNTYDYEQYNSLRFANPKAAQVCLVIPGCVPTVIRLCYTAVKAIVVAIAAGYIVETYDCEKNNNCKDDDKCKELEKKVRDAKDYMGVTYKKGINPSSCEAGMSIFQLRQRANDWLRLAMARAQRDEVCYGGGDEDHQIEQATAWKKVSECQNLMK